MQVIVAIDDCLRLCSSLNLLHTRVRPLGGCDATPASPRATATTVGRSRCERRECADLLRLHRDLDQIRVILPARASEASFSLDGDDCPGGLCPDAVFSADFVASTLLSFDITIDGATFEIEDDVFYSFFPLIELQGGNVIYLDYLTSGFVDPHLELFYWRPFANQAVFQDVDGLESQGTITDVQLQALQAVPEPATLMLFGLGGAGLARHWRQKRG